MRCIHCGAEVDSVYSEKANDVIRLSQCSICKRFADKYVEYELVLIALDLVLHRTEAYRHVVFNRLPLQNNRGLNPKALKIGFFAILLDSYIKYRYIKEYEGRGIWDGSLFPFGLYGIVLISLLETILFVLAVVAGVTYFQQSSWQLPGSQNMTRLTKRQIAVAVLTSSFVHSGIILMIVWDYALHFSILITVFTLTSATTAILALNNMNILRSILIVGLSFLFRRLVLFLLSLTWFTPLKHFVLQ